MNSDPEINQIYIEIDSVLEGRYFSLTTYQFEGAMPDERDYKYENVEQDPNHTGLLYSFRLVGSRKLGIEISGLLIGGSMTLNTVAQTANWLRTLNRTASAKTPWLQRVSRWLPNERSKVFDEALTYFNLSEEDDTRLPIVESYRCINSRSLHFQNLRNGRLVELTRDTALTLVDSEKLAESLLLASARIQGDKVSRFTPSYRDENEFCDFALRTVLRSEIDRTDRFFLVDRHDPQPLSSELGNKDSNLLGYLTSEDGSRYIAFLSNSLAWNSGDALQQLPYDEVVTTGFHRWDKLGSQVPLRAALQLDCSGFSIGPHKVLPLLARLKGARNAAISRHAATKAKPFNSHDPYADCSPPRVCMRMG